MVTLEQLVTFYENLTVEDAEGFGAYYTDDAWFKDPFNEVQGIEAIQRIFRHMFKQVESPRFKVIERVIDSHSTMLVWEFSFRSKAMGCGDQVMRGVSHLRFAADGRVNYHRDYWDAAEELYAKVPVLGGLVRLVSRALAA